MPLLPITSKETIRKCSSLKLRPSDIFICSYPKSGTTWTQHILLSLLFCHKANASSRLPPYKHVSEYAPFYEIDAHWNGPELAPSIQENHTRLGTRVFNTHLRYDMLPQGGCRIIYIVRSPLDTCVSFYHHLAHQVEGGYEGTFEEFFMDWIKGDIAFGSFVDHIMSYAEAFAAEPCEKGWIKRDHGRKLFLLSYQDMLTDLAKVVDDLVDFLDLNVTPKQRQEMLPTFSFQNMKEDLVRFQPQSVQWKNGFSFLRKGVSGDSLAVISEQQRNDFCEWIKRKKVQEILSEILKESNPRAFCTFGSLVTV